MDLAKIRQKAKRLQDAHPLVDSPEPLLKENPEPPAQSEKGVLSEHIIQEQRIMEAPVTVNQMLPPSSLRKNTPFDPLQRILAGREAAGCDDDLQVTCTEQVLSATNDYEEYLSIRVSDEIYGINIMQLKEIIKPREVTEVPRAPAFVSGVISLRGVIIPVLDMLKRLGLKRESVTGKERVVVVKHGEAFSGLLVDEVIQVVRIPRDCFEAPPAVLEGIDRDFVSGIGRADNRMIILLNLESIANINLY